MHLVARSGKLTFKEGTMNLKSGDSVYLPRGMGDYEVQGKMQLLFSEA